MPLSPVQSKTRAKLSHLHEIYKAEASLTPTIAFGRLRKIDEWGAGTKSVWLGRQEGWLGSYSLGTSMTPGFSSPAEDIHSMFAEYKATIDRCLETITEISELLTDAVNCYGTSISSLSLADRELPLRVSLVAVLHEDGEEVVARLPEFSASGFGITSDEAIADLKLMLGQLYEELRDLPDEKLGPMPKRWKFMFRNLVLDDA